MQTLYNIEIGTLQIHIYSEKYLEYDFVPVNSDYIQPSGLLGPGLFGYLSLDGAVEYVT